MCSCATMQDIQKSLGTPTAVQADITLLGSIAKSHIPTASQAKIHAFATQLQSAANLDLTALFAMIPTTGSANGDALIGAAKAYLTSVVQKYGNNNPTAISYMHAVANGLLANF